MVLDGFKSARFLDLNEARASGIYGTHAMDEQEFTQFALRWS